LSTFLGLTHNPFTPPREGFFEGGERKTHLEHLRHLSQWSRRVLVVTGPFGIGKSSLFRELSSNLEANTKAARLSGTVLTSEREVLAGLLQGFGISAPSSSHVEDLADEILAHVAAQEEQKRVCMAMVDDAHLLDMRAVHRLVELVAVSGLRLLMFCEAGLVSELDRVSRMHDVEWFEIRLTGLPKADVREYLEWRFRQAHYRGLLPFTDEQLDNIVVRSGGNLSVIDSMADRLLGELESGEIRNQKSGFPVMHAVLALSLVAMVGLVYLLMQQTSEPLELAADPVPAAPSAEVFDEPAATATLPQNEPPTGDPIWADEVPAQSLEDAVAAESQADQQTESEDEQIASEVEQTASEVEHTASEDEQAAFDAAEAAALAVSEPPPEPQPEPETTEPSPELAEPAVEAPVEAAPASAAAAPVVDTPPPAAEASPQTPQKYKGADWLLRQNPERFTLQLMTLSSRQRASEFISRQDNQEEFAIYSMIRDGQRLHVVTYGVFSGRAAAQTAIAGFSGELARLDPWIRPMRLVQDTVRDNPQG